MNNNRLHAVVQRAQNQEPGAFEELCRLKIKSILYMATRIMGSIEAGEDVAQEVLLRVFNDLPALKDIRAFESWLIKIVIGESNKAKRKRYMSEEFSVGELIDDVCEDNSDVIPHEYLEEAEKREILVKVINELPPKNRLCMLLFYYEEMSYDEIAEVMEISKKEVSNRLFRSKESIRKTLGQAKESDSKKNALRAIMLSAVSSPVLVELFRQEAEALAAQHSLQVVDAVLATVAMAPLAASAAGSVSVAVGAGKAAKGASMGAKALSIFAGGVAMAATVTALAVNLKNSQPVPPPPSQMQTIVVSRPEPEPEPEPASSAMEKLIVTLEDMVGQDLANQLIEFSAQGTSAPLFEEYSKNTGLQLSNEAANLQTKEQYRLYQLIKQSKKLVVITRTIDGNQLDVRYHFIESSEPLPEMDEIILNFAN